MRWKVGMITFLALAAVLPAQEVTLPLARYEELRDLARPEPAPPPTPAVQVAFEKADLRISVSPASARITQELTLDLYGDGWQKVPLTDLGTYIEADFGALVGRLVGTDLLLRGRGRHVVRLDSVARVTLDASATRPTWALTLEAPRAAAVRGELHLGDGMESAEPRGAALLDEPRDNGVRGWVAEPGGSFGFTLYGAATAPERTLLPLRFDAVSASVHEASPGRTLLTTHLAARVLQGELETLRVALPDGFEVLGVDGPLAGWDVARGTLVLTPLRAVSDALHLEVRLSGEAAEELPGTTPEVVGAASQLLVSKVQVEGDGFLHLLDAGAGQEPDARQRKRLPESFRSAPGIALVVPRDGPAPRWRVVWPESTEVLAAQVDRLLVDAVAGTSGRAAYQLWAEVRSSGAPSLTVALPGAELIAARRDGVPLAPGRSAGGWAMPLASTAETQILHLSLLLPLELPSGGGQPLELPIPALSAPVGRVEARVQLPGEHRYSLADTGRAGRVGPPPAPATFASAPDLVRQLSMETEPPDPAAQARALFAPSPGFVTLQAVWSALSPAPAPLAILAETSPTRQEWF